MELQDTINAFSSLAEKINDDPKLFLNDKIISAKNHNPWFTEDSILNSLKSLVSMIEKEALSNWVKSYEIKCKISTVLIVMAGNIPFVGFHDLLSVLISGNRAILKFSSKDSTLMTHIVNELIKIDKRFLNFIIISDSLVKSGFDFVIATGSDSSAKYFNYYFSKSKCIIRKNRRSIAILDGSESKNQLLSLSDDVFLYFGLGCRSVSKIYLPEGYDLNLLFEAFYKYNNVINNAKYCNNYEYNKAIHLMNSSDLIENGFIVLKEDISIQSPIAMLYYEFYSNRELLDLKINKMKDSLQCIVSKENDNFGKTQYPALDDYADNIDTLLFLNTL